MREQANTNENTIAKNYFLHCRSAEDYGEERPHLPAYDAVDSRILCATGASTGHHVPGE